MSKKESDLGKFHKYEPRKDIFCVICNKEETFYNNDVKEEDGKTPAFDSEIVFGSQPGEPDYLVYFCSDTCKEFFELNPMAILSTEGIKKYVFAENPVPKEDFKILM